MHFAKRRASLVITNLCQLSVIMDKPSVPFRNMGLLASLLGLTLALITALGVSPIVEEKRDWVAQVNGVDIARSEYDRALLAMQNGLKRALTRADMARALSVIINEELLLQQAIKSGLTHNDPMIRKSLIQALILAETRLNQNLAEPSENELRAFYERERSFFSRPYQFDVSAASAKNEAQAQAFMRAIQNGASFQMAQQQTELLDISPPRAIPLGKLSDYLGGTVAQTLQTVEIGSVIGPIEQQSQINFYWLENRQGGVEPYAKIQNLVASEYKRRRDESYFEQMISNLRSKARIKISEEAYQ